MTSFFNLYQDQLRGLGYIALSMLLGAVIGFDREVKDKPAGLRTHILVAGAAAFFVILAEYIVKRLIAVIGADIVRSDPIRLIQAVVTGIGFLGAGTIIFRQGKEQVIGLTTAGSILFTAAVGMCVALSQLVLAVGATLLALIVLRGLGPLERKLGNRQN